MPVVFRIREAFDELGRRPTEDAYVTVTSAVELDYRVVTADRRGDREADRPPRPSSSSRVYDGVLLGGLVIQVGTG